MITIGMLRSVALVDKEARILRDEAIQEAVKEGNYTRHEIAAIFSLAKSRIDQIARYVT